MCNFKVAVFLYVLTICVSIYAQNVHLSATPPDANAFDCVVYVNDEATVEAPTNDPLLKPIGTVLGKARANMNDIMMKPSLHLAPELGNKPLIFAPTEPLNSDISDSRTIYNAAKKGFDLVVKAGKLNPILVIGKMAGAVEKPNTWTSRKYKMLNSVLGALYSLYVSLQYRESHPNWKRYEKLYVYDTVRENVDWVNLIAKVIEEGRWITRDICGADPEAMNPLNMVTYIKNTFPDTSYNTTAKEITEKAYPLMALVNQASKNITRFNGQIVTLQYPKQADPALETLYLIGKGVTFDTGGADLKTGGAMVGMSRDKCGAAAILGFIKTASLLPTKVNIKAKLAVVRNNIGSENYVVDTIIKLTNGKRIRIGNTDAEGRNIMTELIMDSITEIGSNKEKSHIYTIATLTGHVIKCYRYIMGIMDNGPATSAGNAQKLQESGALVSDPGEISVIRKEDYDFNLRTLETEDLLQCNNQPSSKTDRGHQFPMAFMVQASGLDAYSNRAPKSDQIKYTHLDVAGSAGVLDIVPTASPMTMLSARYLFDESTVPKLQ